MQWLSSYIPENGIQVRLWPVASGSTVVCDDGVGGSTTGGSTTPDEVGGPGQDINREGPRRGPNPPPPAADAGAGQGGLER